MSDDRFLRKDPTPIPLDQLKPPEFDVREYRSDEDINNTAKTLEREGQIMPILVGAEQNGVYPILDGNHRYFAAKRLGWHDLDAIKTKAGVDEDEVQIVANISRLELSPSERLSVFDYMLNNLGVNVTDAAERLGIDRTQVQRYKKVLNGIQEIKQYYMAGDLGIHACYELNTLGDRDRAVNIAERAVREGYVDADVREQVRYAKGQQDADDVMRGAGSDRDVENMQQVRRNAQAMQDLDPIDQEGIRDAQVSPDGQAMTGEGDSSSEQENVQQGPPCHRCGDAMSPGPIAQVNIHPELASQLGTDEILFCGSCTGKFINWWAENQSGKAEELAEQEDNDG
jgi:ParB family chromosome partitioning protein